MKLMTRLAAVAALSLMAANSFVSVVRADDKQNKKNTARNLGIAGAIIAGHGLLTGNKTETVLGAAGAGIAAKNYEDNRKAQSREKSARAKSRYHRTYVQDGRKYYRYNGYLYYQDLKTGERHLVAQKG